MIWPRGNALRSSRSPSAARSASSCSPSRRGICLRWFPCLIGSGRPDCPAAPRCRRPSATSLGKADRIQPLPPLWLFLEPLSHSTPNCSSQPSALHPPVLRPKPRTSNIEPLNLIIPDLEPSPFPLFLLPPDVCVLNPLDQVRRSALWCPESSVHLPQELGRGSKMMNTLIVSCFGPWRPSASPRAVLSSSKESLYDRGEPATHLPPDGARRAAGALHPNVTTRTRQADFI